MERTSPIIIAIDGTSGSGKSSTAKRLASHFDMAFLDTGAMYRAHTWYCLREGISIENQDDVVAASTNLNFQLKNRNILYLNGKPLGEEIRGSEVSGRVSEFCALKGVRSALVEQQRHLASLQDTVADGRDMGTVVFPNASLKFFFWASAEARAERRTRELESLGLEANYQEVLANLQMRDKKDSSRTESPLKQAEDAILVDTTHHTFESQLAFVIGETEKVLSRVS